MCAHTGRSGELPTEDCTVHSERRGKRATTKLLAALGGKTNRAGGRTQTKEPRTVREKKRESRDSNPGLPPGG